MIALTNFILGLSLAYILDRRLVTASGSALIPGFDKTFSFIYPFVSKGIMHSFLAAGVFTSLVYIYTEDRVSAESCFLGYSSALVLDSLTASGIPLLFPLNERVGLGLTAPNSLTANLAIISLCTALVFFKKHPEIFRSFYSWK